MCWLHQGLAVGHMVASPVTEEGSRQTPGQLRGWTRWHAALFLEEKKAALCALPFISQVEGSGLCPAAAWMLGDGE